MKNAQTLQSIAAIPVIKSEDDLDIEGASKTIPVWIWFLLTAVAVFLIQTGYWYALTKRIALWPDRSAFGDMFGALNTAFSGLAFAGVIYAIVLQRRELQLQRRELILQRRELELTREELQRSASAQEKSEKALKDQVEELIHQRRLSILPGFIVYQEYYNTPVTIKNIGSGVALNIEINLTSYNKEPLVTVSKLATLSHLLPDEGNMNSELLMLSGATYELTVFFNDIEGNAYYQLLSGFNGLCKPQTVKLVN